MCHSPHVEVRGKLVRVGSLSIMWVPGHQAWWEDHLPTESSNWL